MKIEFSEIITAYKTTICIEMFSVLFLTELEAQEHLTLPKTHCEVGVHTPPRLVVQ